MSTHSEHSAWSPEEVDSLENVDNEVQLVSTSSESINNKLTEKVNDEKVKVPFWTGSVENCRTNCRVNNAKISNNLKKLNLKFYSSFDDLRIASNDNTDINCLGIENRDINKSSAFVCSKKNRKTGNQKYDHVESKIKQYYDSKYEVVKKNLKSCAITENKGELKKEDYLEEINKQLSKELDEKNAILSLLQENYEHLLFKYAEAQNRIDELRFKCVTSPTSPCQHFKCNKSESKSQLQFSSKDKYSNRGSDIPCHKSTGITNNSVLVTEEQHFHLSSNLKPSVPRPVSLPLDSNMKFVDRDAILVKATTPTDSEGLSSIITSMSGHSKILNSLDEENQINKKSNLLKNSASNFILEGNCTANNSFDKVKNWQNSLPPLEQIETPETALYNVFPANTEVFSSNETKYNDIPSPKIETDFTFADESCPASWKDETLQRQQNFRRTLSLPNAKRNGLDAGRQKVESDEIGSILNSSEKNRHQNTSTSENDKSSQRSKSNGSSSRSNRKQLKRPILRCSSLPAYHQESIKSGNIKNGIYIPPLDLGNTTLSDDECYCQQNHYLKNNISYDTSRDGSNYRFIQTSLSFSPHKLLISEDKFVQQTTDKSTSITPESSKPLDFICSTQKKRSGVDALGLKSPRSTSKERFGCYCDQTQTWCNICGESISRQNKQSKQTFRNRSNSCESIRSNGVAQKQGSVRNRTKPPFKRSISFGSEPAVAKCCSHSEHKPKSFAPIPSQESLENFDLYTCHLKQRSQIVMKALTAHINNS